MLMTLLAFVLFAVLAALILWVTQQFITDPMILKVIRVVVVVVCVLAAIVLIADLFGLNLGIHIRR